MNENLLTIDDICTELGIGRTCAYKMIKENTIHATKVGGKLLIHRSELNNFISGLLTTDTNKEKKHDM